MHPTCNTAFYKILNAVGDVCERACCDKEFFHVANTFLWFDLRECLCSRYHIQNIGGRSLKKHMKFVVLPITSEMSSSTRPPPIFCDIFQR